MLLVFSHENYSDIDPWSAGMIKNIFYKCLGQNNLRQAQLPQCIASMARHNIVRFSCALASVHRERKFGKFVCIRIEFCSNLSVCALSCAPCTSLSFHTGCILCLSALYLEDSWIILPAKCMN